MANIDNISHRIHSGKRTNYIGRNPKEGEAAIYSLRDTADGPRRYIGHTTQILCARAGELRRPYRSDGSFKPVQLDFPWFVVEVYVPKGQALFFEQVVIDACEEDGIELLNTHRAQAKCGTYAGYKRHGVNGEETCEACRAAVLAYLNTRHAVAS